LPRRVRSPAAIWRSHPLCCWTSEWRMAICLIQWNTARD
jgi:hypothetical protein